MDPIRDGENWYAYAENDPVNYVDLWGLDPVFSSSSTLVTVIPDDMPTPFVVTVTTYVVVDTNTNTAVVSAVSTNDVYTSYDLESVTEVEVTVNDVVYSTDSLSVEALEVRIGSAGTVDLGIAEVCLPESAEDQDLAVVTTTRYRVNTGVGFVFPGSVVEEAYSLLRDLLNKYKRTMYNRTLESSARIGLANVITMICVLLGDDVQVFYEEIEESGSFSLSELNEVKKQRQNTSIEILKSIWPD